MHGERGTQVTGITHDSRHVRAGDLYLARAGAQTHGIAHVTEAVAAGAVAVLTDTKSVTAALDAGVPVVIEVNDPRAIAGVAASWVYDDPSHQLSVFGVTGTNGKTTTTYLLDAGLQAAGHVTGLVGTIETHIAGSVEPSVRTTPEATDLQALFAVMRERGVTAVAMEVSSHALSLDRVSGTIFAMAAFTNLSQDHLDFHGGMDAYLDAKARLFTPELSRRGVVMVDDEWGRRLTERAQVPVTTVGSSGTDWTLMDETSSAAGGTVTVVAPNGNRHNVAIALPGRFNLRNAALAFVAMVDSGLDPDVVRDGLGRLQGVPGRMEAIDGGQPFTVLVDYAHTPDAVSGLLEEARAIAGGRGRVLVVLGCGGDRDRGKRPAMGAAAASADFAWLTNDNPRSEDPAAILAAMAGGAQASGGRAHLVVEPDRRRAIDAAIDEARPGDVVVIAGKGHEQGQEFADRVDPFDDRSVVRHSLAGVHSWSVAQ